MALLLNIDTALETGSICIRKDNEVISFSINNFQNDHASWIHETIKEQFQKTGLSLHELDAIAVTIGPGSYTGLRVGLSTAKGLCYALNVPLITVNNLLLLASAVKEKAVDRICPMIDARRMEVYTATYNLQLEEINPPQAFIVNDTSFHDDLNSNHILFCGNGCKKLQDITSLSNAVFDTVTIATAEQLSIIAAQCFLKNEFADLAYSEPLYVKEFFTPERKN